MKNLLLLVLLLVYFQSSAQEKFLIKIYNNGVLDTIVSEKQNKKVEYERQDFFCSVTVSDLEKTYMVFKNNCSISILNLQNYTVIDEFEIKKLHNYYFSEFNFPAALPDTISETTVMSDFLTTLELDENRGLGQRGNGFNSFTNTQVFLKPSDFSISWSLESNSTDIEILDLVDIDVIWSESDYIKSEINYHQVKDYLLKPIEKNVRYQARLIDVENENEYYQNFCISDCILCTEQNNFTTFSNIIIGLETNLEISKIEFIQEGKVFWQTTTETPPAIFQTNYEDEVFSYRIQKGVTPIFASEFPVKGYFTMKVTLTDEQIFEYNLNILDYE